MFLLIQIVIEFEKKSFESFYVVYVYVIDEKINRVPF